MYTLRNLFAVRLKCHRLLFNVLLLIKKLSKKLLFGQLCINNFIHNYFFTNEALTTKKNLRVYSTYCKFTNLNNFRSM